MPFSETHMGKILQGQSLTRNDFEHPVPAGSIHHPAARDGHAKFSCSRSRNSPISGSEMDYTEDNSLLSSRPEWGSQGQDQAPDGV